MIKDITADKYRGYEASSASPKEKEIGNEFSILGNSIDDLSKNIISLEEKLSGMINNQTLNGTDEVSIPKTTLCEMANSIREKRYAVESINEKVIRLINVIEL